jgi:hypothetical protein
MSGDSGDSTRLDGNHQHGYWDEPAGPNITDYAGDHSHALPMHGHYINVPSHSHNINLPEHNHFVDVPQHEHGIVYGIYLGSTATGITIKINGVDRTSSFGGPFNSDQININLAPYLTIGTWNAIELGSSQLGRIDATVFMQVKMGV